MPKVLRILNRFNLGGPTYNAAYLTKHMPSEFQTVLIGGTKDDTEASSLHITDALGLKPYIIPEMRRELNFINDKIAYHKIREIIKDFKPDIVHTHASKAGALGRLAAFHEGVENIVHTFHGHVFHGYFNPIKSQVYKQVERYFAKKTTRIIAISDIQKYELTQVHKICKPEKVKVIPLGFDLDRFQLDKEIRQQDFRDKYILSKDKVAIGIIGRLVPIKNHDMFLKGLVHLKGKNCNFQAFIVGDGEERQRLEQICVTLKLSFDNRPNPNVDVIFTSWIKAVDKVLPGFDIIALTSLNEGTPVSLIEAQAAEVAVVSTNVGGIENVVLPNESALLCNVNEEEKFANYLLELTTNQTLRNNMSDAGKDFVFENFHYRRLIDDMTDLYRDLLQ